jgi:hypothetical protein
MYWRTQLDCQPHFCESIIDYSRVTVGENESVSVPPLGGFTVEVHVSREENVGDGSHSLQVSETS